MLAAVKVDPHAKNQGHRSNGSNGRALTERWTDTRTLPNVLSPLCIAIFREAIACDFLTSSPCTREELIELPEVTEHEVDLKTMKCLLSDPCKAAMQRVDLNCGNDPFCRYPTPLIPPSAQRAKFFARRVKLS